MSEASEALAQNVKRRETELNVENLRALWSKWQAGEGTKDSALQKQLLAQALLIPNDTHAAALECGTQPRVLRTFGKAPSLSNPKELHEVRLWSLPLLYFLSSFHVICFLDWIIV